LKKSETPAELAEITTDFERDFNAQGIPTLRAAYQLKSYRKRNSRITHHASCNLKSVMRAA
jgi:hypothetical protein